MPAKCRWLHLCPAGTRERLSAQGFDGMDFALLHAPKDFETRIVADECSVHGGTKKT